ncbi:transposase [Streptomyces violascens]|uniref:transposase n=1 Tax=Streptomyces violascens TaxID=67381 RepID=UPI00364E8704
MSPPPTPRPSTRTPPPSSTPTWAPETFSPVSTWSTPATPTRTSWWPARSPTEWSSSALSRPTPSGRPRRRTASDSPPSPSTGRRKQVTCPQGHHSVAWVPHHTPRGRAVIHVDFPLRARRSCPVRQQCTRAKTKPRELTLRPRAEHEALLQARRDQATDAWKNRYNARAGIEGTLSQAVRAFGLRRCRYRGLPKTHLQHVLTATATALNLARTDAWLTETPLARTRTSRLTRLRPAP